MSFWTTLMCSTSAFTLTMVFSISWLFCSTPSHRFQIHMPKAPATVMQTATTHMPMVRDIVESLTLSMALKTLSMQPSWTPQMVVPPSTGVCALVSCPSGMVFSSKLRGSSFGGPFMGAPQPQAPDRVSRSEATRVCGASCVR